MLMTYGAAHAGEVDFLATTLAEKGILTYGEAQQIMTESREALRRDLAKGTIETLPRWIQNISMKGDLRLRHQMDWDSTVNYARIRERLRLRVGFETRMAESIKAAFGLATGSESAEGTAFGKLSIADAEPTSTNHTFGNGFSKPLVMVDFAYLQYTPFDWMTVSAGKMKYGLHLWNPTDLLWDTDINPDGAAITVSRNVTGSLNLFFTGSWLVINEIKEVSNPDIYIVQPGFDWKATETVSVKAAVSYQQYNVAGKKLSTLFGTPAFDYKLVNPSLAVSFKELVCAYSLSVFGDITTNIEDAVKNNNQGSAYGFSFGHDKIGGFGQWQVKAMHRTLEKNSIPTTTKAFGDSDAYGGSMNSTGYEAILAFGLTSNTTLNLDYYDMRLKDRALAGKAGDEPKSLLQVDLVYKF